MRSIQGVACQPPPTPSTFAVSCHAIDCECVNIGGVEAFGVMGLFIDPVVSLGYARSA